MAPWKVLKELGDCGGCTQHPTTRIQLLVSGTELRNVHVRLHDENPFLVGHGGDQKEQETTKVCISNVPLSFSNIEIEKALTNLGCKSVSRLRDECDRDDSGRLTRWKTGRRFLYIVVPKEPLPTEITIGMFTAKIFHREQRTGQNAICGNCLERGHRKGECKADIVCRKCKRPGHKAGDVLCTPPEGPTTAWSREENNAKESTPERKMAGDSSTAGSDESDSDEYSSSNESESLMKENAKEKIKKNKTGKRKRGKNGTDSCDTSSVVTPERDAKLARDDDNMDPEVIGEQVPVTSE